MHKAKNNFINNPTNAALGTNIKKNVTILGTPSYTSGAQKWNEMLQL